MELLPFLERHTVLSHVHGDGYELQIVESISVFGTRTFILRRIDPTGTRDYGTRTSMSSARKGILALERRLDQ